MNLKQHLDQKVLQALMNDQMSGESLNGIQSHLSSCQACQDRKDQLFVEYGLSQLRHFDDPSAIAGPHLSEIVIRQFWRGEINDKGRLEQISAHCFACHACRDKRHRLWLSVSSEAAQVAISLGVLASQVKQRDRKRRQRLRRYGIPALLLLVVIPTGLVIVRRNGKLPQAQPSAKAGLGTDQPTTDSANKNATLATSASPSSSTGRVDRVQPRKKSEAPSGLVAKAQEIDLRNESILSTVRGASENDGSENPRQTIVPNRDRATLIKIELPENNLIGRYLIFIKEPANLQTIATGSARSPDGKGVAVTMDLRTLPSSDYSMEITRIDGINGPDYVGIFDIRLADSRSAETGTSE